MSESRPCPSGKRHYRTRIAAWKQAIQFKSHFGNGSGAYKCWLCKKFHLTTKAPLTPPKKLTPLLNPNQIAR